MDRYDIAQLIAQWFAGEGFDLRGQPVETLCDHLENLALDKRTPKLARLACSISAMWLKDQDDEFLADVRDWLEAEDLFEEAE